MSEPIKVVNLAANELNPYQTQHCGCIILTADHKICLQYRPKHWRTFPDTLATFGGHIETHEMPEGAIIRELHEELGAIVQAHELIKLGQITEAITQHRELIHLFYWHDKQNTITQCTEGEVKLFTNVAEALQADKLMDDVKWALQKCLNKKLISE